MFRNVDIEKPKVEVKMNAGGLLILLGAASAAYTIKMLRNRNFVTRRIVK